MNQPASMPLSMAAEGQTVRLVGIREGRQLRARLTEMGLVPGVEITVISNGGRGPMILGLRGGRVVVGRGMAHQMEVA